MNTANRLTLIRIVMIPLIALIYLFPYAQFNIQIPFWQFDQVTLSLLNIIVLILFAFASVTDFLDGRIARKNNWVTNFGKFLDPIADKLLVNTLFLIFAFKGLPSVPIITVILMIWRDTIVDGIRMLTASQGLVLAAGYLGKIKTATQMIAIILVLLNNLPFELYNIPVALFMVWFSTLMSVMSGISYVMQTRDIIFKQS